MSIWDFFGNLASSKSQQLSWGWIDDNNIAGGINAQPFSPRQCYFVVRLSEMFLKDQRVLWKKFYPMVHGFVRHKPREFAEVAGPGQLKELGTANLDRLIGLAYPLTEPIVYNGADIDVLVGLYAVPGDDAAKLLLGSLGQLSSLAGISAEVGLKIAEVVKAGVEGLIHMDGSSLQLGARDTLRPGPPGAVGKIAKAGYLLAVNTPAKTVTYKDLWVKEGRLLQGSNPLTGRPYDEHDYMLIEVERRDTREDWRTLPLVQKHEEGFDAAIKSGASVADVKSRIGALWGPLVADVKGSAELTELDMDRVLKSIAQAIREKVAALEGGGPFETRSAAAEKVGITLRKGFDLLDVGDAFANRTAADIAQMRSNADKLQF